MKNRLFYLLLFVSTLSQAQVGIGTTSPKAFFNIPKGKTVLFGEDTNYVFNSDIPYKLIWYGHKAALRAGAVGSDNWNVGNVGLYSFATGLDTKATGEATTALGYRSNASGYAALATGWGSIASGDFATAMGYYTTANGYASLAAGYQSTASGRYAVAMCAGSASGNFSVALGTDVKAPSAYEIAIGFNNTVYTPGSERAWIETDRLFTIGNGTTLQRSDALTVLKNGNVGIGTNLPGNYAKVEIQGTVTKAISGQYRYMNINGEGSGTTGLGDRPYSLYTSGRIWCGDEINVTSDQRTKTTITSSSAAEDLSLVNQLRVVDYTFVDKVAKGSTSIKGFLAQQVETVFPEAVSQTKGIVPNIYRKADKFLANTRDHTLTLSLNKSHGLLAGNRVKLITEHGEIVAQVSQVTDSSFTVSNWQGSPDWVFVYGQEVEDLRNIDYNKIFSAGISAIQELSKKVEKLETENSALRTENTSVKSEMASIKSDMEQIKKQLATFLKQ